LIDFDEKSISQAARDPIEQKKPTGVEHHTLISLIKPILNLMVRNAG